MALRYAFGLYTLDTKQRELLCEGEFVRIEPQVFDLLEFLVRHRDRVVSREEIFESVWDGRIVSDVNLSSRINALRRALGDDGKKQEIIKTIHGRGFRFVADASELDEPIEKPRHAHRKPDHTLMVPAFKVVGGEDHERMAEGLRDALLNSMSRHSAINVIHKQPKSQDLADFTVEGTVRGHGDRVRLTFNLINTADRSQLWSERYDRASGDEFELEEEIALAVAAAVRVKLKGVEFERLRGAKNEDLSVADLLNKAAGYFARAPGSNDLAEAPLRLAMEREPDNSMTLAMLSLCLYRGFEYSPLAVPASSEADIIDLAERAVALKAGSYFAHLVTAIVLQDLRGDFERALRHAQAALEANPDLIGAQGMVGIAKCHLGEPDTGIATLQRVLKISREDPHRFRHLRELAIAHFVVGDLEKATEMIGRVVESEPQMDRNRLVQAALLWLQGDTDAAIAAGHFLKIKYNDLSVQTRRRIWFGRAASAAQFDDALCAIGLETESTESS